MRKQIPKPGALTADAIYTLDEVKARMRMSDSGLRQMRRNGLKVHRVGKRGLIVGREFIEFVQQHQQNSD